MTRTETVKIFLGEKADRFFSVDVTAYYDKGDYYTPPSVEFELSSDFYDEDNECICNDLIERYERMFKVDVYRIAIEEFEEL